MLKKTLLYVKTHLLPKFVVLLLVVGAVPAAVSFTQSKAAADSGRCVYRAAGPMGIYGDTGDMGWGSGQNPTYAYVVANKCSRTQDFQVVVRGAGANGADLVSGCLNVSGKGFRSVASYWKHSDNWYVQPCDF